MFAKPFPEFSNKLNAWVTALTCQWLMGPSAINDVEMPDGTIAKNSGVLVERYAKWSLRLLFVIASSTAKQDVHPSQSHHIW
jgi:hypothetical protein